MLSRRAFALMLAASPLALSRGATAGTVSVPAPGPTDTCPVCGMFVAKYPEWTATVVLEDGHADHFDGAKCMFKYLLAPDRFAPGRKPGAVTMVAVKDYYGLAMIDGRGAVYVVGSDVLGPMGHELVPLANDADAAEFAKDHGGRTPLGFEEVTVALLLALDRGEIRAGQ